MAKYYRVQKSPTIYEEEEGTLRPFLGEQPFLERGGQFGQEQVISPEEFGQYKLGTPIGAEFFKSSDDPAVFRVGGGIKTPFKSEQAYREYIGAKEGEETDWSRVATVSPELMKKYQMAAPITKETAGVQSALTEVGLTQEREARQKTLREKYIEKIEASPEAVIQERERAMKEYGFEEAELLLSGVPEKIATIEKAYAQQELAISSGGGLTKHIQGRTALLQRQKAIEMQSLSAQSNIYQNNYELALSKVNRAVEDAIAVEKASISALEMEIKDLDLTPMEEMRFNAIIDSREKAIEREEEMKESKKDLQLQLAALGVETSSLETYDEMVKKLTKTASFEEVKKYQESMGNIYNPQTGLFVPKPSDDKVAGVLDPIKIVEAFGREYAGLDMEQINQIITDKSAPDWFKEEEIKKAPTTWGYTDIKKGGVPGVSRPIDIQKKWEAKKNTLFNKIEKSIKDIPDEEAQLKARIQLNVDSDIGYWASFYDVKKNTNLSDWEIESKLAEAGLLKGHIKDDMEDYAVYLFTTPELVTYASIDSVLKKIDEEFGLGDDSDIRTDIMLFLRELEDRNK